MKNLYKQKRQQGFTIIEVLIVLAIAALILLIVFLAVPALQRNSRNTGRNSDASRVAAAANSYVANKNGNLPKNAANMGTILSEAGTLGQYSTMINGAGVDTTTCVAGSMTATNLTICKGAGVTITPVASVDGMVLAVSAKCDNSGGSAQGAILVGTSRQMALVYPIEGGSAAISKCIDI